MNFLIPFLTQITAPALAVGAIAYLARTIINNSASNARAAFSDELQRGAFEHSTSFAIMHQRRAEVVAKLYTLFVDAEDAAQAYLNPRNGMRTKEMSDVAYGALIPLLSYFRRHRIYLTEDLCKSASALFDAIHKPVWMVSMVSEHPATHEDGKRFDGAETIKQFTDFGTAMETLRPKLEAEFRIVIGSDKATPVGVVTKA